jgi:hypothetical protein
VAIAATVYCPEPYISWATWSLWPVSTRGSATGAAAGPSRGQPGAGAFADEVAFELGQGGEDMEDELAAGGGGVDGLLEAAQSDAAVGQAGDGVDQVAEGAAEAVEFPDDQGVAGAQLVQELLEDRAVGAGAAGGLGEHPIATGRGQSVDLEVGLLVGGGDAGIAKQVSHAGTVSQPSDRACCATLISDTSSGRLQGPSPGGRGGCRRSGGGLMGSAQRLRQDL